jgi:hypothetical protein
MRALAAFAERSSGPAVTPSQNPAVDLRPVPSIIDLVAKEFAL